MTQGNYFSREILSHDDHDFLCLECLTSLDLKKLSHFCKNNPKILKINPNSGLMELGELSV
jgi:hypothetical protein